MSDPSGRFPIGVLARPAPDFFEDSVGTGSAQFFDTHFTGFSFVANSLYNNATDGSLLKVYGISSGSDNEGAVLAYRYFGQFGTLFAPCFSVRLDKGAPTGQIFQNVQTAGSGIGPNPFNLGQAIANLGGGAGSDSTVLSPFPLFIIPSGWSLVITNQFGTNFFPTSFWYQVAQV